MRIAAAFLPLALLACAPSALEVDTAVQRDLLEAARDYVRYGRVDDELRWAPWLCREPMPSVVRPSTAPAGSPHGRKLYYVFAKEREAYGKVAVPGFRQPAGQVIVKEAWVPEEAVDVRPDEIRRRVVRDGGVFPKDTYVPYTVQDGKVFRAATRAGLFLMMKTGAQGPGTDEGWVYATTSADGRTLSSAGRVESCMRCHRDAPGDRLFGTAWAY